MALVYGGTLRYGLVNFDDISLISANRPGHGLGESILKLFNRDAFNGGEGIRFYRPLLGLSLISDHAISGGRAWIYHLSNIAWHLAACLLVFLVLQGVGHGRSKSFMGALLWAVSPAAAAVAWVPGRNDLMLGMFMLGAFLGLLRYWENPGWKRALFAWSCCLAAFFTKEPALLFPAIAIAYALFFRKKNDLSRANQFLIHSGWLLAIALWWAARQAAGISGSAGARAMHSAGDMVRMFIGSWWLALWPGGTALIKGIQDMPVWGGIAVLVSIGLLFAVNSFADNRRAFFGLLWFSVFIVFSLPFKSDVNGLLGHRLYLPYLGLVLVLLEVKWPPYGRAGRLAKAATFMLVPVHMVLAFNRTGIFRDDLSFWQASVKSSPRSALALNGLGTALSRRGDLAGAESSYLAALKADRSFIRAKFNLGTLYLRSGRPDQARILLEEIIQNLTGFPEASYNLGQANQQLGRLEPAAGNYRDELKRKSDHYGALVSLGALLHQGREPQAAAAYYLKAMASDSGRPEAYINLAVLRQQQGRYHEAESYYIRAITLDPGRVEAYQNLCQLYRKQGREAELKKCLSALEAVKTSRTER